MIVSWNWLKEYVAIEAPAEALVERLMMAGLNHEGTTGVGDDLAIDLEVTSNRPDCLSHLGVAREAGVLFDRPLKMPAATPSERGSSVVGQTKVSINCPELCYRYTARVVRGVRVGPSPRWLAARLETVGIAPINNVVDITNYVLFECGQPLHAFDLARLAGPEIIVRASRAGEAFEAINHRTYTLEPGMCVIGDARVAVALGGVMGGAATEVSAGTTDLLIESAEFNPVSIRNTARRLNLHSDSSHRFERGVDPVGVDWASRRCCELILEVAGGELAQGSIDVGQQPQPREPVPLRLSQLSRILGIDVDAGTVRRILTALGNREQSADDQRIVVVPPSYRRDLTREIDLVEEIARIHGYEKIPEDVPVAMVPSSRTDIDRVLEKVRQALVAMGYDEAMTISAVPEEWSSAFCPWTDQPPLLCATPVLRRAQWLRRSVVPSLLDARHVNESLGNADAELFETAKVYLPLPGGLPDEELMLAVASGRGFLAVKGAIEGVVAALNPDATVEVRSTRQLLLDEERSCELVIGGERLGYLGEVSRQGLSQFGLREPATVAEVKVSALAAIARLIPKHARQSPFPAIDRDLNLVVDEGVRWADVAGTVRAAAGEHLESLDYRDTYRSEKDPQLGGAKKSLLMSLRFRSPEGTLTSAEVDGIRDRVVQACAAAHGAELRA
jgi:phenylalanyl-tRNA synthetase beta chain